MKHRSTFGWLDLATGALFLGMGVVLLSAPHMAVPWLVTLLGVIALVSGISDIILHTKIKQTEGVDASTSLLSGIIGILAGALLVLYPIVGQWVLNIVLPLWFIARCTSRILDNALFRQVAGGALATVTLCLNIVALLFGIIMLFNAKLFTLSLGLLAALALIMLGIGNLVEAFSSLSVTKTMYHERKS